MSGPRDQRPQRPRPDDKTVEVPLPPRQGTEPPGADEPWWKNANKRVPPPPAPRPSPPPPAPRQQQPPVRRPTPPPAPARNRHAKTAANQRKGGQVALLIAVGVIAISAGAIGLMLGLSRFDVVGGEVLDVSKAEAGVQRILLDPVDGYAATNVTDVVCNGGADPEIKKGGTFTCDVVVDGRQRRVLAVFQDDDGTYEVDRPR